MGIFKAFLQNGWTLRPSWEVFVLQKCGSGLFICFSANILEVVLCKANPGLVPFQAGRVKVALALELLKKKLSCLGSSTLETPRDAGVVWIALEFSVVHTLASNRESIALNELPWSVIKLRAETKPIQTLILKAKFAHVKKMYFQMRNASLPLKFVAFFSNLCYI